MKIHNYKTMSLPIVIVSLLTAIFVLDGCKPDPEPEEKPQQQVEMPQPEFYGFSISECLEDEHGKSVVNDTVYAVTIDESSLKIKTTNTYFNCCSEEFWEESNMNGNEISVYMYEDNLIPCDCVCPRSVEFILNNLVIGQTYKIILSRNEYEYYSFELVFDEGTDLMFLIRWDKMQLPEWWLLHGCRGSQRI